MRNMPPLATGGERTRRVCLIKPSALGDIVQSLPVLAALRARWPDAHLAWVVSRPLAGLLATHPDLDEVIVFDRRARGIGRLQAPWTLWRQLRGGRFDLAIDLQGLLRSGLMTRATGAARRVGFADAREGAAWAYTDRVPIPREPHSAVLRYWRLAQAVGCEGSPPAPRLGIGERERQFAATALAGLARPILAVHPGAAWPTKRWPLASFAALARRAQAERGASIVLLAGPGEGELARAIAAQLDQATNLAEQTNLLELAAVLAASDVFVGGDTGPMHLAAAVGTRVVALFTCTDPRRAGPYGAGHRVVATTVDCRESYLKRCNWLGCMHELTPTRVWPALRAALEEAVSDPRCAA